MPFRSLEHALLYQLLHKYPFTPQVQYQDLRDCLVKHSIIVRGEFVIRPLNITQAADRRDAFVKVRSCRRRHGECLLSTASCSIDRQQEEQGQLGKSQSNRLAFCASHFLWAPSAVPVGPYQVNLWEWGFSIKNVL